MLFGYAGFDAFIIVLANAHVRLTANSDALNQLTVRRERPPRILPHSFEWYCEISRSE